MVYLTAVQILVALRFFTSRSFLQVIGVICVPYNQPSFTCPYTETKKLPQVAIDRRGDTSKQTRFFYQGGGFPGVIGCVDGTCIKIQAPHENENDVVNRKGFHSINVQAICNHKGR